MTSLRIPRRSFLTGLAGASVALPFLEAMLPRNAWAAQDAPCRYVGMFGGIEQLTCVPTSGGSDYAMPAGFESLTPMREHLSIVTGLSIPTGASGPPPGGKTHPHHGNIMMPLLTGHRSTNDNHGLPSSATADQIVADIYGDTHFRSLEYKAQPKGYRAGSAGTTAQMSYRSGGAANVPQVSPSLAYETLFTGFAPPDASAGDLAAAEALRARRISVLDLVQARGQALTSRVSRADQQRLDRHFSEIRDLEVRLAELPDIPSSAECQQLPDPGSDPSQEDFPNTEHGGTAGYSDEDLRATIFTDLIYMALTCDLTRAATLMVTQEQSMMSIEPLFGAAFEMHDVTHNDIPNRQQVWSAITSWQAGFFGRLVDKLANTPEPTGGTMLDSTALVFTNSGGPSGHGSTNLAMAVAGCPSRLRMGQHVVANAGHPSHVFQTVLEALDIETDFGEVPGVVDGLFV